MFVAERAAKDDDRSKINIVESSELVEEFTPN
jgi:hypothetical protein